MDCLSLYMCHIRVGGCLVTVGAVKSRHRDGTQRQQNHKDELVRENWLERMRKSVPVPGESEECSNIVRADLSMFIKSFENTHPFDPEVPLQVNPLWMCHQFN